MLNVLLNVLFPVVCGVGIGYLWGRSRYPFATDFVTRMVTFIGAPCLIVSTIDKSVLPLEDFLWVARLSVLMMAGFALLGFAAFRLSGLDFRPLSLSVIFPNTGNMGLSLCLFAFGDEGLALGLIVFVVVALVHFSCGDLVLSEVRGARQRLLNLARQPIFLSGLAAVVLVVFDWQLPRPLALTAGTLGGMTIPLMLITLGVSLAQLQPSSWRLGALIAVLRVPGGLLVALLVVVLSGAEGLTAKVLILQGIMPSAVFNYFFALKYQREVDTVASGVVASTLLSLALLPLLLWFMMED